MSWELHSFTNEAQLFLIAEQDWMRSRARRALSRWQLQDLTEDIVNETYIKLAKMSNERWRQISRHKGYLYTMLRRLSSEWNKKYRPKEWQPLSESIMSSTPVQAMEAALLVEELFQTLRPDDKRLLELVFEGCSSSEIAERLGLTEPAARKRLSRLREKIQALMNAKKIQE